MKDSEEESHGDNGIARIPTMTVNEIEFLPSDKVTIQMDIYQLTIAANMTKDVPSAHLTYSIKICLIVFLIQISMIYSFGVEKFDFDQF